MKNYNWRGKKSMKRRKKQKIRMAEVAKRKDACILRVITPRRGSQVVRQGSAKPSFTGPNPVHASNLKINHIRYKYM